MEESSTQTHNTGTLSTWGVRGACALSTISAWSIHSSGSNSKLRYIYHLISSGPPPHIYHAMQNRSDKYYLNIPHYMNTSVQLLHTTYLLLPYEVHDQCLCTGSYEFLHHTCVCWLVDWDCPPKCFVMSQIMFLHPPLKSWFLMSTDTIYTFINACENSPRVSNSAQTSHTWFYTLKFKYSSPVANKNINEGNCVFQQCIAACFWDNSSFPCK